MTNKRRQLIQKVLKESQETHPEGYIYPFRHELLEKLSDEARVGLVHVSPESKQAFCAEFTTLTLAT